MSFILDSIKKAERERKLGQEVPTISLEHTSDKVDLVKGDSQRLILMMLGLMLTAVSVWAATYYFTNEEREIDSFVQESQDRSIIQSAPEEVVSKQKLQDIAIVPIKRMHQSDLKTIKVITEEERIYQPQVERVVKDKKVENNVVANVEETVIKLSTNKTKSVKANKPIYEISPVVVKDNNKHQAKQEIAAIYSEMAKLSSNNKPIHEVTEPIVEIEPASYVVNDEIKPENKVSHVKPKKAVSTGLPSFGELPYDIQERIPEFNVSVHMFHADPSQRRIRINGNMYTEGKSLEQDLALVEITRYGAVFDYQGHLFRYNVR